MPALSTTPRLTLRTLRLHRHLSISPRLAAWEGSKPADNAAREADKGNVQQDAARAGKEAHDSSGGGNSTATSEKGVGGNAKAKKDHPEAPGPVIGMNDERGGKGR